MLTDEQQKILSEVTNQLLGILETNDLSYFECIGVLEMARSVVVENHAKLVEREKKHERMLEN